MKEYYDKTGDVEAAENWRDKILTLADRSQIRERVLMLLDNQPTAPIPAFKKVEIDIKELDKNMSKVKGNVYAAAYELTNKEYWFYQDYLYKNDYKELYSTSVVDMSKYDEFGTTLFANYHYSPVNAEAAKAPKSKMTTFWKYPALDMSHEAAKWYCEWLTFQYNLQSDRKFKRVLFRIPTQQEWTMAALGYKEFTSWNLGENTVTAFTDWGRNKKDLQSFDLKDHTVLYPWWYRNFNFKDRIQNQFDCYLANIKAPETITCPAGVKGDGWTGAAFVGD
jgi:hypothetical protein